MFTIYYEFLRFFMVCEKQAKVAIYRLHEAFSWHGGGVQKRLFILILRNVAIEKLKTGRSSSSNT